MGKIKSKMVKRSTEEMMKKGVKFTGNFKDDKKILGRTMPSKKIRNQISGYLARIKKKKQ